MKIPLDISKNKNLKNIIIIHTKKYKKFEIIKLNQLKQKNAQYRSKFQHRRYK